MNKINGINKIENKLLGTFWVFLLNIKNIAADIKSIGIILLRISLDSWLTRMVPINEPKKESKINNFIFFSLSRLFL